MASFSAIVGKLPDIPPNARIALNRGVSENHPVTHLEQLGVGQRLINLLESEGVRSLQDLLLRKKEQLLSFKNFGEKQLIILFTALSRYDRLK